MTALRFAFHNIVIHPICGVLWLVGATRLADWLHGDRAMLSTSPPPTPGTEDPWRETMVAALSRAADQFAFYADEHAKKGTPEADTKARTNHGWALFCARAAGGYLPSDDREELVKEARRVTVDDLELGETDILGLLSRLADALSPAGRDQAAGGGKL